VVILGQDPYHDGSATGLAFANSGDGPRISPSLAWIKKALEHDYDTLCLDFDYGLTSWAKQGVLLLNTALTVEKGKAGSHTVLWNTFTKELLTSLTSTKDDIIFVLWGKKAQDYAKFIKGNNKIVTLTLVGLLAFILVAPFVLLITFLILLLSGIHIVVSLCLLSVMKLLSKF
jgi:uracil-DNA glycosylase